jgi:hypothetical protein
MIKEFESKMPQLEEEVLRLWVKSGALSFNGGGVDQMVLERTFNVVKCAREIGPSVCSLRENDGRSGFMLALTKKDPKYPILFVQIGEINNSDPEYGTDGKRGKYTDLVNLKVLSLKNNPTFISSSQNLSLPKDERLYSNMLQEIPGGALVVNNEWIISVSGLATPEIDTAVALGIAVGAKFISIDSAENMAKDPRINCKIFMEKQDTFIVPVLQ